MLHDLPTAELAKRLRRVSHGAGDPQKVNALTRACADRLDALGRELAVAHRAVVAEVPLIVHPLPATAASEAESPPLKAPRSVRPR